MARQRIRAARSGGDRDVSLWLAAPAKRLATHGIRTPLSVIESMRRWEQEVQDMLEETVHESIRRLGEARAKNLVISVKAQPTEFSGILEVSIEPPPSPDSGQAMVRASVPL